MTKAKTQRQRRQGRKRRASQPGHVPAPPPSRQADDATSNGVLIRRCAMMGWGPTPENLRRARQPHIGHWIGRMWEAGLLTRRQHDGLRAYERRRTACRIALGAPAPYPTVAAYGEIRGAGDGMTAERRAEALAGFEAADAALQRAGSGPIRAVSEALDEDASNVGGRWLADLSAGAAALADHFGVPEE